MIKLVPELISVGIYDSSLVYKNVKVTKERVVRYFELEFVTEDGGVSYIDGVPYNAKKNNIICAKPGHVRYSELPYKSLFMHMNVDDEKLADALRQVPDVFTSTRYKDFFDLFTKAIINSTAKDFSETLQLADIFRLISLFLAEKNNRILTAERTTQSKKTVNSAIRYINENLNHNITAGDVAEHVHLSKIYFHNIFLDSTGMTPHQYIQEKKLSLAKKLLITTDKSFSEISVECGFSSQSYFNYVFKHEYGISPRMYVKQMLADWEK